MVSIRYSADGLRDLERALRWWKMHNPRGSSRLDIEVHAAMHWVVAAGREGVVVGSTVNHYLRRLFLPKVRYFVYFRIDESGDVWVVRVVHERRHRL